MIVQRIRKALDVEAGCLPVAEVRIGLGYTAVLLESGEMGLSYTPRTAPAPGCCALPAAGRLAGQPARELLCLLEDSAPLERAVGLATANALLARRGHPGAVGGDVLGAIALRPEDRVGMVGHFAPLVARLRGKVAALTIFEQGAGRVADMQPAARASDLLPECTVAIVTATALLGDDLDGLLRAAARCREVVLLGPSTPLLPEVLADERVTWLSGVVVTDPRALLRVVSEGGGTREFGLFVRRLNLRVGGGPERAGGATTRSDLRCASAEGRMPP